MENSPLRQQFIDHLTLRAYSAHTVRVYVAAVRKIAAHYRRSPDLVSFEELRKFLLELCRDGKSPSTLNLTVSAWISFYGEVLDRDVEDLKKHLPRAKKKKVEIRAYSKEEIHKIIYESGLNLKHRTFLSTVYHAGLRSHEACGLQITDIQSSNAVILVRDGKGKKERYTILPARLLEELREYYRRKCPAKPWIFTSKRYPDRPITTSGAYRIFLNAIAQCDLPNRGGIHCLRHSFATHHLQDGMDVARLQMVLGHEHLATTARYLHVLSEPPNLCRSPLDSLGASSNNQD
jgi:integrase/recombinase XerD